MSPATEGWLTRFSAWPRLRGRQLELGHGVWTLADQAVVSLASFLTTVIVGRSCGQNEMGIYGLAVSIFWLAAGIPNALVWMPYTSRAAKLSPQRRAIFAGSVTSHALAVAAALAGILLILGLVPRGFVGESDWFSAMCLALVPFTILMIVREHVRRINLADLRSREMLAIDAPIAILQLVLLVWLAWRHALSATTALVAVAASCLIAIAWLMRNRERFQFSRQHAVVHWSHNQKFGRWLLFVSIAWLLGDSSYRWLVGSIHGLSSLGQFAASQSIVLAINPVCLTINNLAQALSASAYAKGGACELRQTVVRLTLLIAVVAGFGFTALAIVGGSAVHLIFGPAYAGLGKVVAALSLGMFANSVLLPVDAGMAALRRGRQMMVTAIVRLVIVVAAGAVLISWRGLEGVGYAMAVSCAVAAILQWCFFWKGLQDE